MKKFGMKLYAVVAGIALAASSVAFAASIHSEPISEHSKHGGLHTTKAPLPIPATIDLSVAGQESLGHTVAVYLVSGTLEFAPCEVDLVSMNPSGSHFGFTCGGHRLLSASTTRYPVFDQTTSVDIEVPGARSVIATRCKWLTLTVDPLGALKTVIDCRNGLPGSS